MNSEMLPKMLKETLKLRAFAALKIPLLSFCKPQVIEINDQRCVIKLPLNRKTKNHLNSMYFGALSVGADCAGGLIAMNAITKRGNQASLIFKDFHADFLKRAEGDVYFTCEQGQEILQLVEKTLLTGERQNLPVHITATVPDKLGDEPVAKFVLTLSLKLKQKKA